MFERLKKKYSLSKITKKLESDLQEAEFSKNWKEKQKINLKLLWIDFIKRENEIMTKASGLSYSSQFDNIRNREESYFPESFSPKDPLHDKFAEKIVHDYGDVMASPGKYSKCFYKPASLLPYPKEYIEKSCHFFCEQLESEHPNWERPANADEMKNTISSIAVFISSFIQMNGPFKCCRVT